MSLDKKTVFLAGACGLAGTSILEYILKNYPSTRIRASYFKHTKPVVKDRRVQYIFGDLRKRDDCRRMVRGCDCAIMAAASTAGAAVNAAEPWRQIDDNVLMNTQLLSSFYFSGVRRVVYIGSATLYQDFEGHIKEEELDLNIDPHPAYFGIGWVTRFTEKLCAFWHRQAGMEIVMARSTNIFGPYAKFNPATSNFIPAIIRKAVEKVDPFEVWGSPEVTRDVIYSQDFARAIVMMLDSDIKFDVFNIGSGTKTTVDDIVRLALKFASHNPASVKYAADKPTTIKFRAVDCTKIKNLLGWQPSYSIEEGVQKTLEWWVQNRRHWHK